MTPLQADIIRPGETRGQPILTIDLRAIGRNYALLQSEAHGAEVAGVIKANAYGCGAAEVARSLVAHGCETLFVTTLEEALALRTDKALTDTRICVFNGTEKGSENEHKNNRLTAVLNRVDEVRAWQAAVPSALFALQLDTGMNRLGLSASELDELTENDLFLPSCLAFVMSHLACADEPADPMNEAQRLAFLAGVAALKSKRPDLKLSLANSAGIFLGPDYCLDIVRPGIALYGGQPISGRHLPLKTVVYLHAPILQVREVQKGETAGYGATWTAGRKSRLATVPLGYADGILRAAGNKGVAFIDGHRAPMVGRVSMDLITLDVTDVPDHLVNPGAWAEILGKNVTVDDLGAAAGSFGYEILTRLGNRYTRRYINE